MSEEKEVKKLTPVKAIRAKCKECQSGQLKLVRECDIQSCTLYPYRMGKNPNRKRPDLHGKVVGDKKAKKKLLRRS